MYFYVGMYVYGGVSFLNTIFREGHWILRISNYAIFDMPSFQTDEIAMDKCSAIVNSHSYRHIMT